MNGLLFNKYTPRSLSEILNNNIINEDLKLFIKLDNLNILFIGPSGVGKSMYLKLIINECFNKNEITENIFLINNLMDLNILQSRNELKTFCQTTTIKRKKLVCIDDIDIISDQNQQIIRNYIDNYSSNVNFICCCTNIKKVDDSLKFRLFNINLHFYNQIEMEKLLNKIIINEKLTFTEEAKENLLKYSNKNIRKMISLVEKNLLYSDKINNEIVSKLSTSIEKSIFDEYTQHILNSDLVNAYSLLFVLVEKGFSVIDILDEYFLYIKYSDLSDDKIYIIIKVLSKYIIVFYTNYEDKIQLVFLTNNLIKSLLKL